MPTDTARRADPPPAPSLRTRCARGLAALGARGAGALRRAVRAVGARLARLSRAARPRAVAVEVLVADGNRQFVLEAELRRALRRLERALGGPLPEGLAVLVQQVIVTDRQLAGCSQVGRRADGTPFALVRLAVQANGRRHSTDDLLAVLAEQVVGLSLHGGGASVLVPVDLEVPPDAPPPAGRILPLRPDPLSPRGAAGGAIGAPAA